MFLPCTQYALFELGWSRLGHLIRIQLEGDAFQRTTKAIDDVIADTRAAIEHRAKRSS